MVLLQTEESVRESIQEIEVQIQAKENEIENLQKRLQIKENGTVKRLIRNVIPVYAQTLQSRGYEPENALLASPVNVSPVHGVPGRYMMHMQIKGLTSSSPEKRNASMLILETAVNDIDNKYPMRNRNFILANLDGKSMLLGTYQQLLEQADAQKISIKDYIKQNFNVDHSDLMEMWLGDAERSVD